MLTRRGFLGFLAAPAIIKVANVMPVVPISPIARGCRPMKLDEFRWIIEPILDQMLQEAQIKYLMYGTGPLASDLSRGESGLILLR